MDKIGFDCVPAANTREPDDNFSLSLVIPGYDKKDLSLDNQILTISHEEEDNDTARHVYLRQEFGRSTFRRSFLLFKTVDAEKITAGYINGILHLIIPKCADEKQKLSRSSSVS